MIVPKKLEEINRLIADGVEENISLDYKAADALQKTDGKKKEIAKDVSAMANSAGGVIIYGVKEFDDTARKHLPEALSPVSRTAFTKEQLEQIINGNISPKIEGLLIHPISIQDSDEAIYVVEIPQSSTAHQNTRDQRYYKRHNFNSEPMLDYEIRDVMNRLVHPKIEMTFKLLHDLDDDYSLIFSPYNAGQVYARYVRYFVDIPKALVKNVANNEKEIVIAGTRYVRIEGNNIHRDNLGIRYDELMGYGPEYGPPRYDPILLGFYGAEKKKQLHYDPNQDSPPIRWAVHADNAGPRTGIIRPSEITVTETWERTKVQIIDNE